MVSVQDKEEIKFFLDELEENLTYLDDAIIALEETPDDKENLEEIFDWVAEHRESGEPVSIGYYGNIVDVWQYIVDKNIHVELASD